MCLPAALLVTFVLSPTSPVSAETSVRGYYTGEVMHNATGGRRSGSRYLSDAGLLVETALGDVFGGERARLFAYLLWNNGQTFSDRYVGDVQVVSNIDAGQALRLYEIWYEQSLGPKVDLRVGLYDLNSEFDVIPTAQLFVNSSHGIGGEYAASGRNGPSIFPVTSLAARLAWRPEEGSTLRYALLDGVPGDPDDLSETEIDLGGDDGALHAVEYERVAGDVRFGIGGWLYSADFDRLAPEGTAVVRGDGNGGIYAWADLPVVAAGGSLPRVDAFLRYGVANDDYNPFSDYLGAGLVATGLIPDRPNDRIGIAVASGGLGEPYRQAVLGPNAPQRETVIELTWSAAVSEWLRVQPDLQYVVNPAAAPGLGDAFVIGLRFTASFEAEPSW